MINIASTETGTNSFDADDYVSSSSNSPANELIFAPRAGFNEGSPTRSNPKNTARARVGTQDSQDSYDRSGRNISIDSTPIKINFTTSKTREKAVCTFTSKKRRTEAEQKLRTALEKRQDSLFKIHIEKVDEDSQKELVIYGPVGNDLKDLLKEILGLDKNSASAKLGQVGITASQVPASMIVGSDK